MAKNKMSQQISPPLSLYIHIPWCVRKCPYCDFNSHEKKAHMPEKPYIQQLIHDFESSKHQTHDRPIQSIFIGGGTPSLFHPASIKALLDHITQYHPCSDTIEITLEANPGTTEYYDFNALRDAGVNRLSLGVQSFNPQLLKKLGRIHSPEEAHTAIQKAQLAGFDNITIVASNTQGEVTIPAPAALPIFALGLAGLAFVRRRQRH